MKKTAKVTKVRRFNTAAKPVNMTRVELFHLMWAESSVAAARILGVSPSYLARVCRALEVPRPSWGYWAMRAEGRAPPPPLPALSPGNPEIWTRDKSKRVFIKPFYTNNVRNTGAAFRDSDHPLMTLTRRRFEAAANMPDNIDRYLRFPNRFQRADVTVSGRGVHAAFDFANALFVALEARGHRVIIAGSFKNLHRLSTDRGEVPSSRPEEGEESFSEALRPTVVYIGPTPVGLAVIETSTQMKMQYAGYGKFVPVTEWKGRHVGHTWQVVKEMPTGRMKLVAYDPTRLHEWRQEWRETKAGQLIKRVREIILDLETASNMLAAGAQAR
ncbi:hypothetical protein [Rhizobium sp. PL01]|uniref:hypothetical protein n=1 Tax=Rhizobium sp. PL01 TaxID=3085631 RepID=UPI0029813B8C|nr:hypothetical protein [Rhizobium sp. PL01]MDW5312959.1 hypothetical protein [Rhizobium sp. PL01]